MSLTSLAVASSPSLVQSAMSPAATMTFPEGGPGGHSGAQQTARRPPRRATRTIGAYFLLLALAAAPSRSEATTEPAATILTNFVEMAISLLVRGREDTPRASPPRRRHLNPLWSRPMRSSMYSLSHAASREHRRAPYRRPAPPLSEQRGYSQSALHIIIGRSAVNLHRCSPRLIHRSA